MADKVKGKNKKRKLNTRGRKVVRRSIAGVLMASALIVAAIPEDKSGVASANYVNGEKLDYDVDSAEARNGDFIFDYTTLANKDFLDPTQYSDKYKSYEVRKLDGVWTLLWKYEYYCPDEVGGVTNTGVISGFNDTYTVQELNLSGEIITCYDYVSDADFTAYTKSSMGNGTCALNDLEFVLDVTPYVDGTVPNSLGYLTDVDEVVKYFPEEYKAWEQLYTSYLATYKKNNPDKTDDFYPPTTIGITNFSVTGNDMSAEMKKQYYCDHTGRPGYTLVSVKNLARGLEYLKSDNTLGILPDEDSIYICQVCGNNADTSRIDGNSFKFLEGKNIIAIAKNAFYETKNVKNMTVGEGVAYIGDGAFENSFIELVDFASVTYIGNRVFKGCQYLDSVNLAGKTQLIGKEAFYGCKILSNLRIPEGVEQIGYGAFAECPVLETVDFGNNRGCCVGEYAFYNCPFLTDVIFPTSYDMSLGKACFALYPGQGVNSKMTEFDMPFTLKPYKSYINGETYTYDHYDIDSDGNYTTLSTGDSSVIGDYLLANRDNLQKVVMGSNYGTSGDEFLPDNTLDMCINFECLELDKLNNAYVYFSNALFEDVQNENLYVFGPPTCTSADSSVFGSTDGKYYAYPRRSTWRCSSQKAEYVPYVYFLDGKNHYEVGIGDYRYELEVDDTDNTAELLRCEFITNPVDIDLIVPSNVAKYRIVDMSSGCFDALKDNLLSIQVTDDSIENIGDNVFSGCNKLEFVTLGNSVKIIGNNAFSDNPVLEDVVIGSNIESIGDNAFANDNALNDVYFLTPNGYMNSIGTDAFATGSNMLYMHGAVENGYAPFEYAMGNNKINSDSVRICYESLSPQAPGVTYDNTINRYLFTDSPDSYKCIVDEETGEVTLIGYPHFEDLPTDLQTKYQDPASSLNDSEIALVNETVFINVPAAVESVDVKSFLDSDVNNKNKKDWIYIEGSDNGTNPWQSVYGSLTQDDAVPGLFSGYMNESVELGCVGENPSDYATKGNDWILSVDLPGVKSIPDYCFDSCERLQSVIIGDNCTEIGTAAFRGCDNLNSIGTNSNPVYSFENYILYEQMPDGSLELNTCLPARGTSRTADEIWVDSTNDPKLLNVSSLNEGAFESCDKISKVDLSDTDVNKIPAGAFQDCASLTDVELPDTVRNIDTKAFSGCAPALDVIIPCDSNISETAFDKNSTVTIWTYPEDEITAGYKPKGYDKIYIKYLDVEYTITFLNDDLSVYEKITVTSGKNGYYPETDPKPLLPNNKDYEFSYWYFNNPDGIKNVNENRQAVAVFVPKKSASDNKAGKKDDDSGNTDKDKDKEKKSASENSASSNTAKYNVIVENGAGSGKYEAGKVVTVTAYAAVSGMTFDRWTTSNSDIGFSNAYAVSTTFIMPTHDVKVTATYKTASNNSASKNSASSNNASGNNNRSNSSSGNDMRNSTSSNNAGKKNDGGTEVRVTTSSIDNNNKNLASATVAGSTDNFVVKITDSAQAEAQVEAALKALYGDDLSNIKYVAFDISLYDSTGTYLIENSDNLAVTITLPIPDELVPYAGNNKAAAVINGAIDNKTVKFTTIDGVPCMTFTATHFSPYTIYVDTANLVAGAQDITPKTGDGIAPKWFISIALMAGAVVMFLWKDKKKLA